MWIYIEINSKGIVFVEWCVYFCDLTKLQNSEIKIKFFSLPHSLSSKCRWKKYAPGFKTKPWGLDIV